MKRQDGRSANQLCPISFFRNATKHAEGSAIVEFVIRVYYVMQQFQMVFLDL